MLLSHVRFRCCNELSFARKLACQLLHSAKLHQYEVCRTDTALEPQLNAASYCPRKDYACNRLLQGRLQLAGRPQVLLDETMMTDGQLQTTGIHNLQV